MKISDKTFTCPCGRIVKTKSGMLKHLQTCSHNDISVHCNLCDDDFSKQSDYLKHYSKCFKKNSINRNAKYCCSMCKYWCSKQCHWIQHCQTKKHILLEKKMEEQRILDAYYNDNECEKPLDIHNKTNNTCKNNEVNENKRQNNVTYNQDTIVDMDDNDITTSYKNEPSSKIVNHEDDPVNNESFNLKKKESTEKTPNDTLSNLDEYFKKIMNENIKLNCKLDEQNTKMQRIETQQHEIKRLAEQPRSIQQNNFNVLNYLNSECRDALNIYEFIDSLPIDIQHCKDIAKYGYLKPFEEVFIAALVDLDQKKRPIHCTDIKRNSSYIKNFNNEWVRDRENNELENAFDYLQHRQVVEFRKHKNKNSHWMDSDENLDFFNNFVCNVYKMNESHNGEGEKLVKRLVNNTLKRNKLIK